MSGAAHQNKPQIEILEPESTPAPSTPQAQETSNSNNIEEQIHHPKNILEEDDPYSLINLLHEAPAVRRRILDLAKERPDLFTADEGELKNIVGRDAFSVTLQRLRMSFWQEYERCRESKRAFKLVHVYAGICGYTYFNETIDNKHKLAFLLCPPSDYVVTLKEAHQAGLEKLREIFSARITDDEGYLNPKAADMVIKAYALIDARLKGAIVQRVDQRTISATAQLSQQQTKAALGIPTDMDLLEQELEKARKQLEKYARPQTPPTMEQIEHMVHEIKKDE